jgi:hypothetical protein
LHRARVGIASVTRKREREIDYTGDRGCDPGHDARERRGGPRRHGHEKLGLALGLVHAPTAEDAKHRRSERKNVHTTVDFRAPPERLLGRHVRERSERDPGARSMLGGNAVEHARETEVEDLDATVGQHEEIVGLQIPVNDAFGVSDDEHVEDLIGEVEHLADGELAVTLDTSAKRLASEELHRQKDFLSGLSVLEGLHDAGVPDAIGHVPLAQKPLAHLAPDAHLGMQDLDGRDGTRLIAARVHRSHAPDAEHALEQPFPSDRSTQPLGRDLLFRVSHHLRFYH